MKKMLLSLILILLVALPVNCYAWMHDNAERWVDLGGSQNDTLYLEKTSVQKFSIACYNNTPMPQTVEFWTCIFAKNDNRECIYKERIDLAKETMETISMTIYDDKGRVLGSRTYPYPEKKPIIPGTMGDAMLNAFKTLQKMAKEAKEKAKQNGTYKKIEE